MFSLLKLATPFFLTLGVVNGITITVDSAQSGNAGSNAIDNNNGTFWHSQYSPARALPHVATIDLLVSTWIAGFTYVPRQDVPVGGNINGNIGRHDIQVSSNKISWTTVISNVGTHPSHKFAENHPLQSYHYLHSLTSHFSGSLRRHQSSENRNISRSASTLRANHSQNRSWQSRSLDQRSRIRCDFAKYDFLI